MATEGPGEEPAQTAPFQRAGNGRWLSRHCLVKSQKNRLCLVYMGLPWVGSRNAMMIVLFSSGFVAFLLLVLGKQRECCPTNIVWGKNRLR